jgi:succinoglycan biosynthesis protein ExoO
MSVSVVIAAYNAAPFIDRAIRSALDQTQPPLEVLVVDDASTDDTVQVVTALAQTDPRIRLIRQDGNGGPGAARNAGFAAARGEWLAVLDADDAFGPERLEILTAFAQAHQADIAADNLHVYDIAAGAVVRDAVRAEAPTIVTTRDYLERCRGGTETSIDWGVLHPLFRRAFVTASGARYPGIRHAEDFAFVLELMLQGARFAYNPQPHYYYTQRVGSLSKTPSGMTRTRIDYDAVEDWSRALLKDDRITREPELAALVGERARAVRRLAETHRLRNWLDDGAYGSLLRGLARQPAIAGPLVLMLVRRAKRRVLRPAARIAAGAAGGRP